MKIRALIIDDEPLARERIRSLLANEPEVEVVGEAADGLAAIELIRARTPDLLFLDVQMPGMNGFEVLQAMDQERLPMVIFVTAYDQHALKAFEVHALDYLLKPFKQKRFRETVQRAREAIAARRAGVASNSLAALLEQLKAKPEYLSRIPVRDGERVVFVKVELIDYIETAGNYVVIHTGKENLVARETMTALEQKLNPRKFLRISRSTLVNTERIKELQPLFKGEHAVLLTNGKQLTMTRGIREVQEVLKFSG